MIRARFLSRLDVEYVTDDTVVLTAPLIVEVVWSNDVVQVVTVPTGFTTDFASVPRLPLAYMATGGIGERAACVHDYLYSGGLCSRSDADAVFRACLAASEVAGWRRWLMWSGVRLFGGRHYGRKGVHA